MSKVLQFKQKKKEQKYTIAVLQMVSNGDIVEMDLNEMMVRLNVELDTLISYFYQMESAKLIKLA